MIRKNQSIFIRVSPVRDEVNSFFFIFFLKMKFIEFQSISVSKQRELRISFRRRYASKKMHNIEKSFIGKLFVCKKGQSTLLLLSEHVVHICFILSE